MKDNPANRSLVAILVDSPSEEVGEKAEALAARLSLPLVLEPEPTFRLLLTFTDARLELRLNERRAPGPVYVDFLEGHLGYMRQINPFGDLIQAVCLRKEKNFVVDATAGLGRDAFILVHKGCTVLAVERSPILCALMEDGIARSAANPDLHEMLRARLTLHCGDALPLLEALPERECPDVVYLDPMFPPRKKSALVKKEMRILRTLVGDDPDAGLLLEAARGKARKRVVVKRMRHAPDLAPDPVRTYKGKTTRFDVYGVK